MKISLAAALIASTTLLSTVVTARQVPSHVDLPDHVLLDFKRQNGLKPGATLPLQALTNAQGGPGSTIDLPDGTTVSLDGLTPQNMFSAGATCLVDGVSVPCGLGYAFTKIDAATGAKILVLKDTAGNIASVKVRKPNASKAVTLQAVAPGVLTAIPDEAVDETFFNSYIFKDEPIRRQLRGQMDEYVKEQQQQDEGRHLQSSLSPCSAFREIQVATVAESSFCARSGSGTVAGTQAAMEAVMANVAFDYEQDGLCLTAAISHSEIWCDANQDPYVPGVQTNKSGCGDDGLLDQFQAYWNANRVGIPRDTAQLFSGTGLECNADGSCVIGCAYVGVTCSNPAAAYGVNYVSYTTNAVARSNLVAHEMGHNLGSSHDATLDANKVFIMYPMNSGQERTFSAQSVNSFRVDRNIGTNGCFTLAEDPNVTPAPTASPTPGPTFSPTTPRTATPTAAPTAGPTFNPTVARTATPTAPPVPCSCSAFDGLGGGSCNGQCGGVCSWVGKTGSCIDPNLGGGGGGGGGGGDVCPPSPDCSSTDKNICSSDACCKWTGNPKNGSCGPAN